MKRYVVPVILAVWAVGIALGFDLIVAPLLLLVVAVLIQAVELARTYRHQHRRRL